MPTTAKPLALNQETGANTADRMRVDRENPGYFWDEHNGGRKLTRQEAWVFGITYEEFPRMIAVREAWLALRGLVKLRVVGHRGEAVEETRRQHPQLTAEVSRTSLSSSPRRSASSRTARPRPCTGRTGSGRCANAPVRYADEQP